MIDLNNPILRLRDRVTPRGRHTRGRRRASRVRPYVRVLPVVAEPPAYDVQPQAAVLCGYYREFERAGVCAA